MKGLGFRIRKFGTFLYRFFFICVNFFYLHVPNVIYLRYKKRKLFFISQSFPKLKELIVHILLLKRLSVYRKRGLFYPRQLFIMKPGKKRF